MFSRKIPAPKAVQWFVLRLEHCVENWLERWERAGFLVENVSELIWSPKKPLLLASMYDVRGGEAEVCLIRFPGFNRLFSMEVIDQLAARNLRPGNIGHYCDLLAQYPVLQQSFCGQCVVALGSTYKMKVSPLVAVAFGGSVVLEKYYTHWQDDCYFVAVAS